MANYWDKFVEAVVGARDAFWGLHESNPLLGRYAEESGIPDIFEELARFSDPDVSIADTVGILTGAAFQTATMPLQSLGYLAAEVNRGAGALALDTMDRGPVALGIPGFTTDKPSTAWDNYVNSYQPPQMMEKEDGTFEQAQGVFYGATAGGLLVIANDRMIQSDNPVMKALTGTWAQDVWEDAPSPYETSWQRFVADPGPYNHGTYIPPSFDVYAPDIGASLADSDLRYATLASDLAVEIALDPLNLLAPQIGAAIAARKMSRIAPTVGAATVGADDLLDAAKTTKAITRLTQQKPGIGMIDQRGMAYALTHKEGYKFAQALARNTDPQKAAEALKPFIVDNVARIRVAQLSTAMDNPDDIFHLFNAVTYRNVDSVDRVRAVLDDTSKVTVFDELTLAGDNPIRRALADFPEGSILPEGHALRLDAQKFLDDALDLNPEFAAKWESLADDVKRVKVDDLRTQMATRERSLDLFNQTFGDGTQADRLLEAIPAKKGAEKATRILTGERTFAESLRSAVSNVVSLPGGAHRFTPKFLLTARPGLIFSVDSIDAGDKFNDFINYADNIIGSSAWGPRRTIGGRSLANILPDGYRFAEDAEVIRIKNAFWDAGMLTDNPSMLRAELMNELQHYALRKIAESSGYAAEVAEEIAGLGMDKARNINAALNSTTTGYMTTIVENGSVVVIKNHPTTVAQTATFVPIMDLAGVRKAMHSAPMRKYIDNSRIASIVESNFDEGYVPLKSIEDDFGKWQSRNAYGAVSLRKFGRTQNPIGLAYHGLIDIAEVVNTVFKTSVLLRFGYPVRNLSEGALAAVGSGVGLTHVMANADIAGLVTNSAYNTRTWGTRLTDKALTWSGFRANETALNRALETTASAITASNADIAKMIDLVSDPVRERALLRIMVNPESPPAEVERAREALEYLSELRHRMALPVQDDLIAAGLVNADDVGDAVKVSQTLYHADLDSALSLARDANNRPLEAAAGVNMASAGQVLGRPISMTPNSTIAQGAIDSQWTTWHMSARPYGSRNVRPRWAAHTVKNEADAQAQWVAAMERFDGMADTHVIQYRKSPNDPWRGFQQRFDGELRQYTPSSKNWEFRVMEKTPARPDKAPVVAIHTFGKEVDLRGGFARQSLLDQYTDLDEAILDAAIGGYDYTLPPVPVRRRGEPEVWYHGTATDVSPGARIDSTASRGGVGNFDYADGSPLKGNDAYAYATNDPELALHYAKKAAEQTGGVPSIVKVKPVGPIKNRVSREARAEAWEVVEPWWVAKRVPGDRAAQDAVSEVLAKRGIYRAVYDDAPEWGGINVIVHPKGIGNAGLKDAVASDVARRVEEAKMLRGPDSSAVDAIKNAPRRVRKAWNKGETGLMDEYGVVVDYDLGFRESDILRNGGFESAMEEAVSQHADLLRRQEGLLTAGFARRGKVNALSKRRGLRESQFALHSMYGPAELQPDMLHQLDGFKYRMITSADATTNNTIARSAYRADLLDNIEMSMLEPVIVRPENPRYFDAFASLLGRYYNDNPANNLDPVVWRALQPGDRQRLYEETVEWVISDPKGREWARTMGLTSPGDDAGRLTGTVERAIGEGDAARAARPVVYTTKEAQKAGVGVSSYRRGVHEWDYEASVGELVADQFNFIDNYVNANPAVRQMFMDGNLTGDSLRALYDEQPWELQPLNGALSPTSAEYRRMMAARESRKQTIVKANDKINELLGIALNRIGSAPETRLLRHPMFNYIAQTDFQQRVTHAEAMLQRSLSQTEKVRLAKLSKDFAAKRLKETLYTLEGRSTMEEYLRFISPFFPAWWNTLTRWGRFYRANPANPARLASRWGTIQSSGLIVDENGQPVRGSALESGTAAFSTYLMIPVGVGDAPGFGDALDKMFPGTAEAMSSTRVPLRSFDVIFQGDILNPGAGPFVAVPMQYLLTKRDDWYQNGLGRQIIERIMPVGPENAGVDSKAWDVIYPFLPTFAKRAMDTVIKPDKWAAQYNQNVQLLFTQRAKGEYEGDDSQLADDAMRLTYLMSAVKVLSGLVAPVASQQVGYPEFLAGQYRELQDVAIAMGHPEMADELFYEAYPIDFLLTISSTANLTRAPATAQTTANQEKYTDLQRIAFEQFDDADLLWAIDGYHETEDGQGVLGQVTSEEYNPYSRRKQVYTSPEGSTEKYRDVKEPAEVIREGMIRVGWLEYDKVEAAVEARLVSEGLPVGSWEFLKRKKDAMSAASAQLAEQNPIWAMSRGVIDTKRFARNAQFFNIVVNDDFWLEGKEDHDLPKMMREYLSAREAAALEMEQRGEAKTTTALANLDIGAKLAYKAEMLSQASPSFRLWYNRYFRNDVVNVDEVG